MSRHIRRLAVVLPLAGTLLGAAWTAAPGALADTWTGTSRPPAAVAAGVTWGAQPAGVTWGSQPGDTWT